MTHKCLGKISAVKLGYGGYQDAMFGLTLTFKFEGSGVVQFYGFFPNKTGFDRHIGLDHEDFSFSTKTRSTVTDIILMIMERAGARDFLDLIDAPVECVFDSPNGMLTSWRILEECL